MDYNTENASAVLKIIEDSLQAPDAPPMRLKKLWWAIVSARSRALTAGLRHVIGDKVHGGPFKGMVLTEAAIEAYRSTVLLGCYEHELHPVFEKAIARNYKRILNIGCSVGYYAVGMALRMPQAIIEAFDTDPMARRKCADLARANGVEDRVKVSGEFFGEDFDRYGDGETLALVDIEGGELGLLKPEIFHGLRKIDLIVELHDMLEKGISTVINERFAASHDCSLVENQNFLTNVSGVLPSGYFLDPFDHIILGWEGRDGFTPWGVYYAKS